MYWMHAYKIRDFKIWEATITEELNGKGAEIR